MFLKKKFQIANTILVFCLLVVMFYQLIFHFSTMSISKILTTASILPIIMVPYFLDRVFHYQVTQGLQFVYYLFIFISLALGSVLNFYHMISWFDLFAHFLTGIVASFVSCIFLKKYKILKRENTLFVILFMILFSVSISAFWEFFEFFSDKLFGGDTQYVASTGVSDTMEDMLIAFFGSLLFSMWYYIKSMRDRKFIEKIEKLV